MKNVWGRILVLLLTAVLAVSAAGAELTDIDTFVPEDAQQAAEKDGYHFNAKGFLVGDNPSDRYLLEDEENGVWAYSDANLSIRIIRHTEELQSKKLRLYCVAEVWASAESPLFAIMSPAGGDRPAGYGNAAGLRNPVDLVKDNPVMLAVSDDYYGYRQFRQDVRKATWPTGIIIRNGEILYDKTRDSSKKRDFPPLDTLAVYGDGSMKTFVSDELTAEEYIAQGAVQVFAFGPWLIRNGEPNPTAMGPKYEFNIMQSGKNPRTVIGMIEPYHYILMVVGRPNEKKYTGATGEWLIGKLQEYGCVEALNLDGGGTSHMVFNGKTIIQGRWGKTSRRVSSMIAFGAVEGFD